MAAIRENIRSSQSARDNFLDGIVQLDQEESGITAADLYGFLQRNLPGVQMAGINQELSTYDLFVFWHVFAMNFTLSVGNAAHSGPIFLPWHRMYLIRLEQELQRVLGNDDFGLPYWDWASDGELSSDEQWQTQLWSSGFLGESRNQVASGPLAAMQVRLWQDVRTAILWSIDPRPIVRQAGLDTRFDFLPRKSHVRTAMQENSYDQPPWSQSAPGHRNRLEGWINGPQLHNLVHVWIGGDMGPGTSPNDPAFFLNHCNVDRIWEAWMDSKGRTYRPAAGEGPSGHRFDDTMIAILGDPMTPQDVLDPNQWYSYDSLVVD